MNAYLVNVNAQNNNYKFYEMHTEGADLFVSYGRIGGHVTRKTYCASEFYKKYDEKIRKGYVDKTDAYSDETAEPVFEIDDSPSTVLYTKLYGYSNNYVKSTVHGRVTRNMVTETKKLLAELRECDGVWAFNDTLRRILEVSPRVISGKKSAGVLSLYAEDERDFGHIIERETDLLNAMNVVTTPKGDFCKDIDVHIATDKQKEEVMKRLTTTLRGRVKEIYRVIPKAQKKAFDEYIEKNNIKKVKQMWHGSRNCNWLGIVSEGLKLNPNAQITGKMFGYGVYMAPASDKSWGYTSYHGTRWARGASDTAFMGLYAVAYGKPYMTKNRGERMTQGKLKSMGYDCLHATSENTGLHKDEIVFYDENAVLMNYLVEFEG